MSVALAPHVVSPKDVAAVRTYASSGCLARAERGYEFLQENSATGIRMLEMNAEVGVACAVAGAAVGAAGGAIVGGPPTALAGALRGAAWGFSVGFLASTTYELVNLGTSPEYLNWLASRIENKVLPVYRQFQEGGNDFQLCPITNDFIRIPVRCPCHGKTFELGAVARYAKAQEGEIAQKNRQLQAAGKTAIYTKERCFLCPSGSNPEELEARHLLGLGDFMYDTVYHDTLYNKLREKSELNPKVAESCKAFTNEVVRSEVGIAQQKLAQMAAADDADPESLVAIGAEMVRSIVKRRSILTKSVVKSA